MIEPGGKAIGLATFGDLERESLAFLPHSLSGILDLPAQWGPSLPIPARGYHVQRRQYLSRPFLAAMAVLPGEGILRLLGITDVDLFTPDLNFIFGQALIGGRDCIISTARLRSSFYGLPEDPALLRERAIKEAVHELGHTFGLAHCGDPDCVMSFSNSLADTDRKGEDFCSRCGRKYVALLG